MTSTQLDSQSDPFKNSSFVLRKRSSESIIPGLESPKGITMIVGGTNVRFVVTDSFEFEPISFSLSWTELAEKMELDSSELLEKTDEALDFLSSWFVQELKNHSISLDTVKHFGLSVAGLVDGNGVDAKVSTVNTGIRISNLDLLNQFVQRVSTLTSSNDEQFKPTSFQAKNDAVAAILGEYLHPLGAAYKTGNAIFVILGTGIGGAGITNHKVDKSIREFGHTFFYLVDRIKGPSTFLYRSFKKLLEEGYVDSGQYVKPREEGEEYIETYLAGPQLAIRFAKHLGDDQALISRLAIECLKIEGKDITNLSKDDNDLIRKIREIHDLGKFDPAERVLWGTDAKSAAVKQIGRYLISLTPNQYTAARTRSGKYTPKDANNLEVELTKKAWDYREKYMVRLGRFLGEIGNKKEWRGHQIILGGGVAEGILAGPNSDYDLRILREFSWLGERLVISQLNAETREAAFVTEKLKDD